MARARSHGATAAATTSSTSGAGNEEDIGLLAPGAGDDFEEEDYSDDGVLVHARPAPAVKAGSSSPLQLSATSDYFGAQQQQQQQSIIHTPRTPRTPRTPNRVRFDLRPTIVDPNAPAADDHHHHARESFELDDEDPLNPGSAGAVGRGPGGQQRVPLLTGIEAPSVALANSPWSENGDGDVHAWAEEERARPKSGLRMAFMNMANSIIGAGIIGQPYAFRQAGLLAGIVLLIVLTFVVDWTICLIVVNSKLSGASSFQGTVEKCFGKTGLIAISVAQWAFAFGGMVAFGVIVGDSIPHVLGAIWPGLREMPVLGLLADRRVVIVVFTLGVSYPLALYRDIAKLAKASTLALISMGIIVFTVVVQGILTPAELKGELHTWNLLVINDGIFQAIGVISFGKIFSYALIILGEQTQGTDKLKPSCATTTPSSFTAPSRRRQSTASPR